MSLLSVNPVAQGMLLGSVKITAKEVIPEAGSAFHVKVSSSDIGRMVWVTRAIETRNSVSLGWGAMGCGFVHPMIINATSDQQDIKRSAWPFISHLEELIFISWPIE
jgi:sulfite exporter TauE/SafE